MSGNDVNRLQLVIRAETGDERVALEQALLRARASELSEVRRRETRLVAGYGDAVTRDSMTGELAAARLRWTMLDKVLEALRAAGDGQGPGRAG
jgi:hypothetical protein